MYSRVKALYTSPSYPVTVNRSVSSNTYCRRAIRFSSRRVSTCSMNRVQLVVLGPVLRNGGAAEAHDHCAEEPGD